MFGFLQSENKKLRSAAKNWLYLGHYTPKKAGFGSDQPERASDRFRTALKVSGKGTPEKLLTTLLEDQRVKFKAGAAEEQAMSS